MFRKIFKIVQNYIKENDLGKRDEKKNTMQEKQSKLRSLILFSVN